MCRDHVDYVENQFSIQLRAVARSFGRTPGFEARRPRIFLRFASYDLFLRSGDNRRPGIDDFPNVGVQRRRAFSRISPLPSDETGSLSRRDSQPVHLREKAAAFAYALDVRHVLRILTFAGVASPIFRAVKFVGATRQQEESALVGTARRNHWDPRGELVRMIPYDPVHIREDCLRGWNNRADLVYKRITK